MGNGQGGDAEDGSWTEMESVEPDMVEAVPIRHGMVLGGRYAIEKIIGRGGSGVVVRAHDRDLKAVVAVKIVRADLAGQRVWAERLAREVRLARQIQHPNVCRVFDFQQADGRAFLVMELAQNGTLREEIRSGAMAARPLAERIADARTVASALAAIHDAGIVHRDLTPQNLLRMADGRLVVSDFGLAVDVADSTSSVHGGTVAYMAPEVVRGERSTFASDIWALGVVMHEIVFGVKPQWSDGPDGQMHAPSLVRRLTEEERAVLRACRACTARKPADRLTSGADAGRMLTERARRRLPWPRALRSRPLAWAAALTISAALATFAVGLFRARARDARSPLQSTTDAPLIVPTGEPADWTDVSKVLAEVPDRIQCMVGLPDKHTIRFVWGKPPRAEDIDTRSGRRTPSALVRAAYAEGCPDVSPDGKRLIYQGHVEDGRAFAFMSEHPDGRDARPIVATAEPTHLSEPKWLADGDAFTYDVDIKHVGIFSLATNHGVVVPQHDETHAGTFRWTVGNQVFVEEISLGEHAQLFGHQWPSLAETARFRLHRFSMDLESTDDSTYYYTNGSARGNVVFAVEPRARSSRRIGFVRDRFIRYLVPIEGGLSFVSMRKRTVVDVRVAGERRRVDTGTYITDAALCGDYLVTAEMSVDDVTVINRRSIDGRFISKLADEKDATLPSCSSDGRVWSYVTMRPTTGVMRCDAHGCKRITEKKVLAARISPDGSRVILISAENRGFAVYLASGDGENIREITQTETVCPAGWSSPGRIWVSRRRGEDFVWTEIDVDANRETGKTTRGTTDCMTGDDDPSSPVDPGVRVIAQRTAQVRVLPSRYLEGPR